MPGINGVDVLKSVKEIDRPFRAHDHGERRNALAAEAIKRGAFSYVPKRVAEQAGIDEARLAS